MAPKRISFWDRFPPRTCAFFLILCLPILGWLTIVLLYYYADIDYSSKLVAAVAAISPLVTKDLSLFGEITPALLAGSVIALSPAADKLKSIDQVPNIIAVVLAAVIYVQYLHLTLFFSTGGDGVKILEYTWNNFTEQQKSLLSIISNVKVTATVIVASIIGLRLKDAEVAK